MASPYVCPYCQGELREENVDFTKMHIGKEVAFKNVPADVCKKCREFSLRNAVEQAVTRRVKEAPLGKSEVIFK